jgi:hypothetical protein
VEHRLQQRLDAGGNLRIQLRRGHRLPRGNRTQGAQGRLGFEWVMARGELVKHDAQGEHVRGAVRRAAVGLLGRHVGGGPHQRAGRTVRTAGVGVGERRQAAGQAEVEDLHVAVGTDHDVFGLDVAVDDPRGVGGGQRPGHLGNQPRYLLHRGAAGDQRLEGRSLDEFHDEEGMPFVLAQRVDGADVRVVQRRGRPRFAQEAVEPFRVAGVLGGQELQGDVAPQARLPRLEDDPHAAAPELPLDLVAGHGGPGRRHCRRGFRGRAGCVPLLARQPFAQLLAVLGEAAAVLLRADAALVALAQLVLGGDQLEDCLAEGGELGVTSQVAFDPDAGAGLEPKLQIDVDQFHEQGAARGAIGA